MKRQEVWTISLAEAGAILANKVGMDPAATSVQLGKAEGSEETVIILISTIEPEVGDL